MIARTAISAKNFPSPKWSVCARRSNRASSSRALVEGSRHKTLKVPQRIPRLSLGMTAFLHPAALSIKLTALQHARDVIACAGEIDVAAKRPFGHRCGGVGIVPTLGA